MCSKALFNDFSEIGKWKIIYPSGMTLVWVLTHFIHFEFWKLAAAKNISDSLVRRSLSKHVNVYFSSIEYYLTFVKRHFITVLGEDLLEFNFNKRF